MSKSVKRVLNAATALGLQIEHRKMPDETRTAAAAAQACGCDVGQIAKSMMFEGAQSGDLILVLVSGRHNLNLDAASDIFGEELRRADPKRIRKESGFAIGGVAPIGHLCEMRTWMDAALLEYPLIWGADGTPHGVFSVTPNALKNATRATVFENRA